jgi:hypothetical protein
VWLVLLAGCNLLRTLKGADAYEDPCDQRAAFWADTDGDGVGDTGSVYIGCERPDGYVDVPPPTPDTDTDDTDP